MKKIIFTGGGTLGHVMPNLYLMEELSDYSIAYIGSNGIEKDIVKEKVRYYFEIPTIKLTRGKILKNLKIPFVLISAILQAKKILKEYSPDVIFSKGGYVSLPVCIAGRMLKIPVITHESDYSFGLANKIILKVCDKMCANFKNLEHTNKKVIHTGPIFSRSFENADKNTTGLNLDKNKPTILIVGGSLGSQKINDSIFPILKELLSKYNIIHITGKGNLKIKSYDNYNSFEMRSDMFNLYNIADFVIGRSGAGVTAECYYKHLPMLLIPLENKSSRGDQTQNAKYYVEQGVARIIRENELTPTRLLREIQLFSTSLNKFRSKYHTLSITNGRDKIIKLIKYYTKKEG